MTDAPIQNLRQAAKARTRQKVIEAAAQLFSEPGGYEAATTRRIAAAAGMSTGAMFANFTGKAELYRTIYGHSPVSAEVGRVFLLMMVQQLYGADAMLKLTDGLPIPDDERAEVVALVAAAARGEA